MVCDVFCLAKLNAPAIIFIDEIDAITTARFDAQTGADRDVQQILMECLNQMDGFDQTVNVEVIRATNWQTLWTLHFCVMEGLTIKSNSLCLMDDKRGLFSRFALLK